VADEVIGAPELPKAQRMKIQRHGMPAQDPLARIRNFFEVALGYSPESAVEEAQRCLQCANPPCVKGCPVGIDIPAFVDLIRKADFEGSLAKIKETNTLPAICGRVCPQEEQCERLCILGVKSSPVTLAPSLAAVMDTTPVPQPTSSTR
jgi:glutamate synthase (NADPH/NADH) small chain